MAQKPHKKIKVFKKSKTKCRKKKKTAQLSLKEYKTREINKKILEMADNLKKTQNK